MGQGVAVTPLQLATAYSAIANGGEWVAPSVVRATTDPSGREHPLSPGLRSRVIEPATAADLRTMLAAVVQRGTGKAAAIPGYDVAGKTGTAWKAQDGGYGYAGERAYVASFAGMVPVSDPKLVIVVMIDEPQGNTYSGGDAAAPAFAGIALPTLVALSIPPANWNAQATAGRAADQKVRAAAAVAPTTTTTARPPTTAPAPTPASSTPGASTQTATALPSTAAPATAGVGGHG
jgi:stage V sporulation protein D (sporulation-specific penicillin-binding protein)